MSFKEYPSGVTLANMALGMISESRRISSFDDAGHVAQACKRWYKPVVARLLETHHWGLATKRASAVAITNDRSNEWLYSYAVPDDLAFPVGFTLGSGVGSVSYYKGLAGLFGMINGRPIFHYVNGKLYSNIEGELEYVSFDITEADFNATFSNIVIITLASRLALELPKDYDMFDALEKKAADQINIAITQNLNMGNQKYGALTSESEMVRGSMFYGDNWDFIPRGPAA